MDILLEDGDVEKCLTGVAYSRLWFGGARYLLDGEGEASGHVVIPQVQ